MGELGVNKELVALSFCVLRSSLRWARNGLLISGVKIVFDELGKLTGNKM